MLCMDNLRPYCRRHIYMPETKGPGLPVGLANTNGLHQLLDNACRSFKKGLES